MANSTLFDDQAYLNPHILEALLDAIIIADLEQRFQYINLAACQMLGVNRDATLGAHLKDLPGSNDVMTPQQAETDRQSLIDVLKTYAPTEDFKIPLAPPYEQIWLRRVANGMSLKYHSAAIWGEAHQEIIGIVVTVQDVTTEHRADEVLNSLFNDMMTPLSSIKGFAEVLLLESDGLLSDEQRQMVKIMAEKAGYLLQLRKEAYDAMLQQRKQWRRAATDGTVQRALNWTKAYALRCER